MANGKIRFGKQSGGKLALVFPDGVTNTEVIVPESGILATEDYVDNTVLLSTNDSRVKTALNASGSAPIYACRAWVNFNGTGTVAIRASGNVSSITDNGTGDYTVNFTTAMPDDKYSIQIGSQGSLAGPSGASIPAANSDGLNTSSSARMKTAFINTSFLTDWTQCNVSIFR